MNKPRLTGKQVEVANRVEWLAAHSLPMDVIAERVGVPVEAVEAILYGEIEEYVGAMEGQS